MSGRGFIAAEVPQQCDDCGNVDELRPYGVDGKKVCLPCAEKNPEELERRMMHHLFGDPL